MTTKTYAGPERRQMNGEMKQIAHEAGREGARECLTLLGVDVKKPLEMQQDFAHLRKLRQASEDISKQAKRVSIGVLVTGVLGAIYLALKNPQ